MIGGTAEDGTHLPFSNATISMLGGVNGIANHGLVSTGANSQISYVGGTNTIEVLKCPIDGAEVMQLGMGHIGGRLTRATAFQVPPHLTSNVSVAGGPVINRFLSASCIPGATLAVLSAIMLAGTGCALAACPPAGSGISASGAATVITEGNCTISTTGASARGVLSQNQANVTLNNSSISTTGTVAYGVQALSGGTVTFNGGTLATKPPTAPMPSTQAPP